MQRSTRPRPSKSWPKSGKIQSREGRLDHRPHAPPASTCTPPVAAPSAGASLNRWNMPLDRACLEQTYAMATKALIALNRAAKLREVVHSLSRNKPVDWREFGTDDIEKLTTMAEEEARLGRAAAPRSRS